MPISNPSLPMVPDGLPVDELTLDLSGLLPLAGTTPAQAVCPTCGHVFSRVRGRDRRTLQDLSCLFPRPLSIVPHSTAGTPIS